MLKRSLFMIAALLMICAVAVSAAGQEEAEYPDSAIDFLIPFGAGGSADVMGRTLANEAEKHMGAAFVPVNQVGGSGAVMYQNLINSAADGYTVGWNSTSILTTTAFGNVPFEYDAFEHIARIGYTSMPIAVRADSPYDSLDDLVEHAKDNPGIRIGNASTGSGTHLVPVALAAAAGVEFNHVPLGADRRIASLLGGEVDAVCVPLPEIAPHVQSGDAKLLGFPTLVRDEQFTDVPTFQEAGYDVVIELFRGISVPKGTQEDRIAKLVDAFENAAYSDEFLGTAASFGFVVDFMGAEEFADYLADQNEVIVRSMELGGLID